MRNLTCLLLVGVLLAPAAGAEGELRLAGIFNDHMVLQQEQPLIVWGQAKAGAEVTVTLTESAKEAAAAAINALPVGLQKDLSVKKAKSII